VPVESVAACHAGGRGFTLVREAGPTDAFVIITPMDLQLAYRARVNRNLHLVLEARSWLLPGRPLGIGLGDRLGGSQGVSALFEGGVRLATKRT
jgi:hypothetical protein